MSEESKSKAIRFAVGSAGGLCTRAWKTFHYGKGDDVYLTPIGMPSFKVSLHGDGNCTASFDRSQFENLSEPLQEAIRESGRHRLKWTPRGNISENLTLAFRLLFCCASPLFEASKIGTARQIEFIPRPAPDQAVEVSVVVTEPGAEVHGTRCIHKMHLSLIDRICLPSGRIAWVSHRTGAARELLPGIRDIAGTPKGDTRPLKDPSESLGAVLYGIDDHGAAYMLERRVIADAQDRPGGEPF